MNTAEPLNGYNAKKYPELLAEYASKNKEIQDAARQLGLLDEDEQMIVCCAGDFCSVSEPMSLKCSITCGDCKGNCHPKWCCEVMKGVNMCTACDKIRRVRAS